MKIEILKAKNTKGNTLMINGVRVAGYKSGFGYELIDSFNVSDKELKSMIPGDKQKCPTCGKEIK